MTESMIVFDLRVRGCPACNHLVQLVEEYFADLQGKLSRDDASRIEYADEGGLCPLHTWQLAQFSSPRGIARGHEAILQRLADSLDRMAQSSAAGKPALVVLKTSGACSACHFVADQELKYITSLNAFLQREGNLERYERTHGLCLRHLQQMLNRTGDEDRKRRLLRLTAQRLREIRESMKRFDRKYEELKRELITRDEKDAYRRCLVMLSGEKTVFSPFMKGL